MARVLVTGFAGGLAKLVATELVARGDEVHGVDYRPVPKQEGPLAAVELHQASYHKTKIEDVFRSVVPEIVLHLGRVGNLGESAGKRFALNVVGSQKIMTLALAHRARRLVVLSTFHIYGAHPSNHIPIHEDEPLRAGLDFPELADAIQLDNMASTWVYRHPEVSTVVLRPTNVVGPTIKNTMSSFLRQRRVPHVMGFDPMTQFLHEEDLAAAILAASGREVRGIYNVAGPTSVPWRRAIELASATTFPVPGSLARAYLRLMSTFPGYLLEFFKYPCVISDSAFRRDFDWSPRVSITDTLRETVAETRRRQSAEK
jgi:UDP-glucose 4-epimerase